LLKQRSDGLVAQGPFSGPADFLAVFIAEAAALKSERCATKASHHAFVAQGPFSGPAVFPWDSTQNPQR